jgi:hypothetical protein
MNGSETGTQITFSSGPLSSAIWKTPIGYFHHATRKVGSFTKTSTSNGSPSSANVSGIRNQLDTSLKKITFYQNASFYFEIVLVFISTSSWNFD